MPREIAAELAPDLDAGRPWTAVVLREQRRSPRDPRHGLTMLLAPADAIELRPALARLAAYAPAVELDRLDLPLAVAARWTGPAALRRSPGPGRGEGAGSA